MFFLMEAILKLSYYFDNTESMDESINIDAPR